MAYRIKGKIQHYAWGGFSFLPSLLHIKNVSHKPFAEYWLGAHPKAASDILREGRSGIPLDVFIGQDPDGCLGKEVVERFGRLPYLFKVLDVRDMLSIQVHPSKNEAEKGFAGENAAGIALDAPDRNYKDDNHKPEMMVALSKFYLLHGFLEEHTLIAQLQGVPELSSLVPVFKAEGYEGLYGKVMRMPQAEVDQILTPLLQRILPLYNEKRLRKKGPDFWAARALSSGMTSWGSLDRGIFSIYFFNILCLQPGEGIFQGAGIPHAYLEGQNMELMANSDNVLRGGLTPKHVDVEELLKHVRFRGVHPQVIKKRADSKVTEYPCPVPDFKLSQIRLGKGEKLELTSTSIEILMVLEGKSLIKDEKEIGVSRGEAVLLIAGEKIVMEAESDVLVYRAGVPNGPIVKV